MKQDWLFQLLLRFQIWQAHQRSTAETSINIQSDRKILNSNLAVSRVCKILTENVLAETKTAPWFTKHVFFTAIRSHGDGLHINIPTYHFKDPIDEIIFIVGIPRLGDLYFEIGQYRKSNEFFSKSRSSITLSNYMWNGSLQCKI